MVLGPPGGAGLTVKERGAEPLGGVPVASAIDESLAALQRSAREEDVNSVIRL